MSLCCVVHTGDINHQYEVLLELAWPCRYVARVNQALGYKLFSRVEGDYRFIAGKKNGFLLSVLKVLGCTLTSFVLCSLLTGALPRAVTTIAITALKFLSSRHNCEKSKYRKCVKIKDLKGKKEDNVMTLEKLTFKEIYGELHKSYAKLDFMKYISLSALRTP